MRRKVELSVHMIDMSGSEKLYYPNVLICNSNLYVHYKLVSISKTHQGNDIR